MKTDRHRERERERSTKSVTAIRTHTESELLKEFQREKENHIDKTKIYTKQRYTQSMEIAMMYIALYNKSLTPFTL